MSAITSSEAGSIDWSSIGPSQDGHVERLAREVDHPRADLEPRRVEARPAEHRDESAVAAPQLQHPRRAAADTSAALAASRGSARADPIARGPRSSGARGAFPGTRTSTRARRSLAPRRRRGRCPPRASRPTRGSRTRDSARSPGRTPPGPHCRTSTRSARSRAPSPGSPAPEPSPPSTHGRDGRRCRRAGLGAEGRAAARHGHPAASGKIGDAVVEELDRRADGTQGDGERSRQGQQAEAGQTRVQLAVRRARAPVIVVTG